METMMLLTLLLSCSAGDSEPVSIDWDEECNPLAMGDDCLTPYPSLHWTVRNPDTATGRSVALNNTNWRSRNGDLPVDLQDYSGFDGASPIAPILVNLGADVHPDFLSLWGEAEATVQDGAPIALVNTETGESVPLLVEMNQVNRGMGYDDRHPLILRPMAPLEFGGTYAIVLTSELTDADGAAFEPSEVFLALRDGTVTDDSVIEDMRLRFDPLFEVLEGRGWQRDELLLVSDFLVASEEQVIGPLRSMKEQALQAEVTWTIDEVVDNGDVQLIYGSFTPLNFLTESNELVIEDYAVQPQGEARSYPFTMAVSTDWSEPVPLVLIGHGLFGRGEGMIESSAVQDIARLGHVVVATDWIGLSGGDLDLIKEEVLQDLSRVNLVTDRLAQSHVNNMMLVEAVVEGLGAETFQADALVVDGDVYYYGISLGGIQGATQTAMNDRITRSVLAVPGAGWATMIQRSIHFDQLDLLIDLLYQDPLGQNVFMALLQSRFDLSDPGGIATQLRDSDKAVVIQEAIGDCQVPNEATDLLIRSIGAVQLGPPTDPLFDLEEVAGPVTGRALTQIRVPEDLDYWPPRENVIPEEDNGVHNSAVLQEATYAQIEHLYATGEIIHPCDGTCDPD